MPIKLEQAGSEVVQDKTTPQPLPKSKSGSVNLSLASIPSGTSALQHPEPPEIIAKLADPVAPIGLASEVEIVRVADTQLMRNGIFLPDQVAVAEHLIGNAWPHPLTHLPRPELRPYLKALHQNLNSHSEVAPHLVVNSETGLLLDQGSLSGELSRLIIFSYSLEQSLSIGFVISAIAETFRDLGFAVYANKEQSIFVVETKGEGIKLIEALPFEELIDHKRFFGTNHQTNSRRFQTTEIENLGSVQRLGTQALAITSSKGEEDLEVTALQRFTSETPNIWRRSSHQLLKSGRSLFN